MLFVQGGGYRVITLSETSPATQYGSDYTGTLRIIFGSGQLIKTLDVMGSVCWKSAED